MEETEGWENHPRGSYEAEGSGHGGKQSVLLFRCGLSSLLLATSNPAVPTLLSPTYHCVIILPFALTLDQLADGLAHSAL